MYEEHIREDVLFCMLYAAVAMMSVIACCYLLFRRGNAFAPNVTSPVRLRRWTAILFGAMAFSHLWYLPILFYSTPGDVMKVYLVGALLDSMTIFPLAAIVLLTMLQDRRRPLWPVVLMTAPLVLGMTLNVIKGSDALWPVLQIYLLLLCIGLVIYMYRAVRRYGRWLRDNYADLEHKEVWQSFMMLSAILLLFGIYVCDIMRPVYLYIVQVCEIAFVCYLTWRVETLSDLSVQPSAAEAAEDGLPVADEPAEDDEEPSLAAPASPSVHSDIGPLLQKHCIEGQLYLQHDLTLQQLAKAIGINRYYVSQYFSSNGTTYNAYINGLRINHFVRRYHEAIAANGSFTTKQLASESGYRSYSTFSLAFKQLMGRNVTEWMQATDTQQHPAVSPPGNTPKID